MMKRAVFVGCLLAAALASGCATLYTSIEKGDDGSYTVTEVSQGFMRFTSRVYRCEEVDQSSMKCTMISE